MSDDLVNIEVNGIALKARRGSMLIESTDAANIPVPRFCYHKKLSVAANCRMCLVQMEKSAKPVPACATPVMEGMKVQTASPAACAAQQATMEFLLINHPLDCPICDQGGECELQDLAMGFGSDVSRFSEGKRVVKDKNLGSLIQTDMTRCIHCTRCVRFGEEIAGLRELGATGRGEHMEIGTYVEKAVRSELSGNVIDVCPVGALTSKPYRYSARAWELRAAPGIAAHDAIGSNIYFHLKEQVVKRVVPREHEAVNEVWISDRDRYSYEGLYHPQRLHKPRIREHGAWREVAWETAIQFAAAGLREVIARHGADPLAGVISANATLEECYLFQKLMRGLGAKNIDHRLRQIDFRDDKNAALHPQLGMSLADLEQVKSALLIGANLRKEQPLANHRLRKAVLRGADVAVINPLWFDTNYRISEQRIVKPSAMVGELAAVAHALQKMGAEIEPRDVPLDEDFIQLQHKRIAENLHGTVQKIIVLGEIARQHPDYSVLRALAVRIARAVRAPLAELSVDANTAGACLAGALPHRGVGGAALGVAGLPVAAFFNTPQKAYVLFHCEPADDIAKATQAQSALAQAEFTVAFTAYATAELESDAQVLLPLALYAENEGTLVNMEGRWQSFSAAVKPVAEARAGWRILRVLANQLALAGFDYQQVSDVTAECQQHILQAPPFTEMTSSIPASGSAYAAAPGMLELQWLLPMVESDALVRRAAALQASAERAEDYARLHPASAQQLQLDADKNVRLSAGGTIDLAWRADNSVPEGVMVLPICARTRALYGVQVKVESAA